MKGKYIGHIIVVSKLGIETDPEKTNIFLNWFIPTTMGEVRTFLGFTKCLRNFSEIARPLSEVMPILTESKQSSKKRGNILEWGGTEYFLTD